MNFSWDLKLKQMLFKSAKRDLDKVVGSHGELLTKRSGSIVKETCLLPIHDVLCPHRHALGQLHSLCIHTLKIMRVFLEVLGKLVKRFHFRSEISAVFDSPRQINFCPCGSWIELSNHSLKLNRTVKPLPYSQVLKRKKSLL